LQKAALVLTWREPVSRAVLCRKRRYHVIPADLQDKLAAFLERQKTTISDLIVQIIRSGRSPEDVIFVIPAEDADSQKVTAIMFGLEKEAAARPLPKGFVVGKDDFFSSVGRTFEKCEPDICRVFHRRIYGEAKILAVIDGYFCGAAMMYSTSGRLPQA